ncbi:sigma-54-dependent Fis family transcriptional regulator [candidate division WOR-3 bacterium]|nr:sigma-54-dependent Fis family transcriptional regulator [candidate division WOR-3 bacterium]
MNVIIIDDNRNFRVMLKTFLSENNYTVFEASNSDEALSTIRENPIDLALLDLKLGSENGIELLKLLREHQPLLPIILMTAYATIETAVTAIKLGANDYIQKPINLDMLAIKIDKLIKEYYLNVQNLNDDKYEPVIIYKSEPMKKVINLANNVAGTDATVLISGESGTGKELLARYIHSKSNRKGCPFVAINCAAIPHELIESELFGAEKGAFTGAYATRVGKFELANHGTLFLDEIGDLSLNAQAKVLRALDEKKIRRIGSNDNIALDIRIISATNKNLKHKVDNNKFRTDLYYRISTYPIVIPPLREHTEDIPLLLKYYLEMFSRKLGKNIPIVTPNAFNELINYNWPGNIREFKNIIERAVILNNEKISTFNLTNEFSEKINLRYRRKLEEITVIKEALKSASMNKRKAAKILGISYRSLLYKIKEYKITDNMD